MIDFLKEFREEKKKEDQERVILIERMHADKMKVMKGFFLIYQITEGRGFKFHLRLRFFRSLYFSMNLNLHFISCCFHRINSFLPSTKILILVQFFSQYKNIAYQHNFRGDCKKSDIRIGQETELTMLQSPCKRLLRPGQTLATFQRNILQHCCMMLRQLSNRLAKCTQHSSHVAVHEPQVSGALGRKPKICMEDFEWYRYRRHPIAAFSLAFLLADDEGAG